MTARMGRKLVVFFLLGTLLVVAMPVPQPTAALAQHPTIAGVTTAELAPGRVILTATSLPQVSAGWLHTCVANSAGWLSCWGQNGVGQATVPGDLGQVIQVSAGSEHTCAVTSAHTLRCWGRNDSGQAMVPGDLGQVSQVSAGFWHTCAVTSANALRCWGNNWISQATIPSDPFATQTVYSISGRVSTSDGTGVAGATILITTGLGTTTAADGSFTLANLVPRIYTLTAKKAGDLFSAPITLVVSDANLSGQDFEAIIGHATYMPSVQR